MFSAAAVSLLFWDHFARRQANARAAYFARLAERSALASRGLPIDYIKRLGNSPLITHALSEAARLLSAGRWTEAVQSARECLEHPDAAEEVLVDARVAIGFATQQQGRFGEARKEYLAALRLLGTQGTTTRLENAQTCIQANLAVMAYVEFDSREAVSRASLAFSAARMLNDSEELAHAHDLLGQVLTRFNKREEAIRHLKEAYNFAESHNKPAWAADVAGTLGVAHSYLDELDQAEKWLMKAARLHAQTVGPLAAANDYTNLACVLRDQGRSDLALDYLRRGHRVQVQHGYAQGTAASLGMMAAIYIDQKRFDRAEESLEESLRIGRAHGLDASVAEDLSNLGVLRRETHHPEEAIALGQHALSVFQRLSMWAEAADALGGIGIAYYDLKDYRRARYYYKRSLKLARKVRHLRCVANALHNLALDLKRRGKLSKSLHYLQQAKAIYDECGVRHGADTIAANIQQVESSLKNGRRGRHGKHT